MTKNILKAIWSRLTMEIKFIQRDAELIGRAASLEEDRKILKQTYEDIGKVIVEIEKQQREIREAKEVFRVRENELIEREQKVKSQEQALKILNK